MKLPALHLGGRVCAVVLSLTVSAWGEEPPRGSDPAVRAIIQSALDEALHAQTKHLFEVWMKDTTRQPERAAAGIRKAVSAYRHAIKAIETETLTWNAPEIDSKRR